MGTLQAPVIRVQFPRVTKLVVAALVLLPMSAPLYAEEEQSKFQIHGFLTQALATAHFSDLGPTEHEIVLGIPDGDTTTDYRFLALQFRYQISPKDVLVVQLSSRSLGDSPINLVEDDLELDWAFYERSLGDATQLKVGRIQIPLGIFNETRDVGTVLPFYRPSYVFYREGTFTSETVDGALLHHTFGAESDWSLGFDVFYGEYELVEIATFDPTAPPLIATAEDVNGLQLWLNTPASGLRFGLGGQRRDVTGGSEGIARDVGATTQFDDWYTSFEYLGSGLELRSEYREISARFGSDAIGFFADATNAVYYAQVGYSFTEQFAAYVQFEQSDIELKSIAFTGPAKQTDRSDLGVALNYHFTPGLVLKAEYHEVDQELQAFNPVFLPGGGFRLHPFTIDSNGGNYSILTFSVSF